MAVNGCLRSLSQARAILLLAATLCRLDTQEIEGLNSMIKTAIARAQNGRICLPLLTSRVCTRKLISMNTAGTTRVQIIKPFAASLARSAYLFSDSHYEILNDEARWKAPNSSTCGQSLPGADILVYDPQCGKALESSAWAIKYHKLFIKLYKVFWKSKTASPSRIMALVVPTATRASAIYIGCSLAHSQAIMTKVEPSQEGTKCGYLFSNLLGESRSQSGSQMFQTSMTIVAALYPLVEAQKCRGGKNLKLQTQEMEVKMIGRDPLFVCVGRRKTVCELRAKYVRKQKQKTDTLGDNKIDDHALEIDGGNGTAASSDTVPLPAGTVDVDVEEEVDDAEHALEELADGNSADYDHTDNEAECDDDNRRKRDQEILRILTWAEDDSGSDMSELADEDKNDLDDMVETNNKMAAVCANEYSSKDEMAINRLANRVQDSQESVQFVASNSTLTDPEQQQEALLQEILTRSSSLFEDCENQQSTMDTEQKAVDSRATDPAQVTLDMLHRFAQKVVPTMEEAFLNQWQSALLQAIDALVYRHQSQNIAICNELSLVFEIQTMNEVDSASVALIQWSSINLRNGREVHLDEHHRIVCPVNFIQKARSFVDSGVHIILPAVGESVRRVKKAHRPPLPVNALVLLNMYKTAIACQGRDAEACLCLDDADVSGARPCGICHSDHGQLFLCALCALTAHRECTAVLRSKSDVAQISVGMDNMDVGVHIIPNILLGLGAGSEPSQPSWHTLPVLSVTNKCCYVARPG